MWNQGGRHKERIKTPMPAAAVDAASMHSRPFSYDAFTRLHRTFQLSAESGRIGGAAVVSASATMVRHHLDTEQSSGLSGFAARQGVGLWRLLRAYPGFLVLVGFAAAMGWAFAGSLLLGLGTGPASRTAVWLWLVGEMLIGAAIVVGLTSALPPGGSADLPPCGPAFKVRADWGCSRYSALVGAAGRRSHPGSAAARPRPRGGGARHPGSVRHEASAAGPGCSPAASAR